MISFTFETEKFSASVAYLVQRKPGVSENQICKLMFFADKEHLLRYGRTITGDTYCALSEGPVPSNGLDCIDGIRSRVVGARAVDLDLLSESDTDILDEVVASYGDVPAGLLEEMSRKEESWRQAPRNGKIAFELFFEGRPYTMAIRDLLIEEQATSCELSLVQ